MRLALLALAVAACGGHTIVVTGGNLPAGPIWLVGFARNAKLGDVVETEGQVVYCDDRAGWAPEVVGRPIVVAGTAGVREEEPPPIGPRGERSTGAEGPRTVLVPCAAPPSGDAGLLDAERAVFAALEARDRAGLER